MTADNRLPAYAELVVRVGANVQPGQNVFVVGLVEHAPLVRAIAEASYAAGARYVDVRYVDQHVRKAFIRNAAEEELTATQPWDLPRYQVLLDGNAALIQVSGEPEPDLLARRARLRA
jgi:aminopeptidase